MPDELDKKEKKTVIKSLITIASLISIAIALVSVSFTIGTNNPSAKYDKQKIDLENLNRQYLDSIERLKMLLRNDSVNLDNIIAINTHHISINMPGDMPTIAVANNSTNPCTQGDINDCWQLSTKAKSGDVIGIQIYCFNSGDFPVENIALGCSVYRESDHVLSVSGGVKCGNVSVSKGNATIFLPSRLKYSFYPGSIHLMTALNQITNVPDSQYTKTNAYTFGSLDTHHEVVLTMAIKIE